MKGSMLLVSAANSGEVRKLVESDVYYTAGVVRSIFARAVRWLRIVPVGSREAGHYPRPPVTFNLSLTRVQKLNITPTFEVRGITVIRKHHVFRPDLEH
jgi:hypothetical protein